MSSALATQEEFQLRAPEPAPVTVMDLISRAAVSGASVEQMQQLFELKLRIEADEARKAFNAAMARFKANPPRIAKNVQKQAGPIALNYASLDSVVDAITPALSAVGVRHRWEMKQEGESMTVTCILSHDLGHSESTTMTGPYDKSGGKNPIQAIASAQTYLQRYTLLAATGCAAADTDDDGIAAGKKPANQLPDDRYLELRTNIENAGSRDELKRLYLAACEEANKIGDQGSIRDFAKAKDKRWTELAGGAR